MLTKFKQKEKSMLEFLHPQEIKEVKLKGTFEEMGAQYIEQLGDWLVNQKQLNELENVPDNTELRKEFDELVAGFLKKIELSYPVELKSMLKAAAMTEKAKQLGLSYEDLIKLEQALMISEIAHLLDTKGMVTDEQIYKGMCSFLGVRGEHGVGIARNFDWRKSGTHMFTYFPVMLSMEYEGPDKDKYPFKTTTFGWAGVIAGITIFNNQNLHISINSAAGSTQGKINFNRPYYFAQMLMAMMKCPDFKSLQDWVKTQAPDFPFIINFSSPADVASAEASPVNVASKKPDDFKVRIRKPASKQVLTPRTDRDPHILAATNKYRKRGWEPFLGEMPTEDEIYFSEERKDNMFDNAKKHEERFTDRDATLTELSRQFERPLGAKDEPGPTVCLPCQDPAYENPSATCYTVVFASDKEKHKGKGQFRVQQAVDKEGSEVKWSEWRAFKVK